MLSPFFYESFRTYDYILIYQLDAVVFSDRLMEFASLGFDYIGAPLRNSRIGWLTHKKGGYEHCGNGGLSLRNIASSLEVLERAKHTKKDKFQIPPVLQFILAVLTQKSRAIWLHASPVDYPFNEDGFWSFEASKYLPSFKTAPIVVSEHFAIEKEAPYYLRNLHGELPFGVHAWKKYDPQVWSAIL